MVVGGGPADHGQNRLPSPAALPVAAAEGDSSGNASGDRRGESTTTPLHPREAPEATTPSEISKPSQTADPHLPPKLQHEHQEQPETDCHPSSTRETNSNSSRAVVVPGHNDVLLGRGRRFHTSEGNMRMWRIISLYKSEYDAMHKSERHGFADKVLNEVLEGGTRFLRRIGNGKAEEEQWEEVERSVALMKIWHAIRSKGKKNTREHHHNDDDNNNQEKDIGEKERPAKKAATATASGVNTQFIQTMPSAAPSTAGFLHPSANSIFGAAGVSTPGALASLLAVDQRVFSRPSNPLLAQTPFSLSPYAMQHVAPLHPYGLPGMTREVSQGVPRIASLVGTGGHQSGYPPHPDQHNLLLRLREEEAMKLRALRSYLTEAMRQKSERESG